MQEKLDRIDIIKIIRGRLSSLSDYDLCMLFNNYIAISTEGLQEQLILDDFTFILKTEQYR